MIDVSPEEMIPTVKTLVPKIFDAYGVKTIRSFFFGKLWGYMDNGCLLWSFKMYHKSAIIYFGANFVFITGASPKSRENNQIFESGEWYDTTIFLTILAQCASQKCPFRSKGSKISQKFTGGCQFLTLSRKTLRDETWKHVFAFLSD